MPKYIDADRFKQFLEGEEDGVWCEEICDDCIFELEYRIDHFPSADVAPVMHGKWIETDEIPNIESDRIYRCSVCGYADEHSPSADVPFCWHCGARMQANESND